MNHPHNPSFEGDPSSRIVVLTESPTSFELIKRKPLQGPSGQLFDQLAGNNGVNRHRCFVMSIWGVKVERRARSIIYQGKTLFDEHGFTEDGMELASATTERLRDCRANIVLALGQVALAFVTGKHQALGKWRGSILAGTGPAEGRKVVASYDPTMILHGQYMWRYVLSGDLKRVAEEAAYPELKLPVRDLRLEPSLKEALAFMAECKAAKRFATDLEVLNHQVSCFSLCFDPSVTLTIPFADELGRDYWSEREELTIWQAYADLMSDPFVEKVNQNLIGFDAPFLLMQNNIYTAGRMLDTMVAQHILYPELPKGLDFLCSVYTREPYYKDEGKMWKRIGDAGAADLQVFWRYCGKDAACALEAWTVLERELLEGSFMRTYELTERLAMPLAEMSARGLAIDQDELAKTKVRIHAELEALEEKLRITADYPFNPGSPKQCLDYFYKHKGLHPYVNKDGNPTTDDKALSRLWRRYNIVEAKLVQEIRALKKLLGTYIEVGLDADGRLRCSWNPRGTWTGRLSSSQTIFGTGLNLQNLHPAFKGFIVSKE